MNGKRRPRPRRAGRKIQLKRVWKSFSLPPRGPAAASEDEVRPEPTIEAAYNPVNPVEWRLIPVGLDTPRPRICSIETLATRVRVVEWRLRKLDLAPVIYQADIPATDPRYEVYITKRSEALYPKDPNNSRTEPATVG